MEMTLNKEAAIEAQRQYCKEHKQPFFVPKDGYCCTCGPPIFGSVQGRHGIMYGYSVQYAEEHLITGCPFCHKTFTD